MDRTYTEAKKFDKKNFTAETLPIGDYENCHFTDCNFSNVNLSQVHFMSCTFTGCNISMSALTNTAFRDVVFTKCKLLGLRFDDCSSLLFLVRFEDCNLTLSSFYKRRLKGTLFKQCNLQEVDFAEADLSQAIFNDCDMLRALFDNTILEKADLRTSYNYSIDPMKNKLKKAKFSVPGIVGLVDNLDIIIE